MVKIEILYGVRLILSDTKLVIFGVFFIRTRIKNASHLGEKNRLHYQ